jgi:hypothetical protein
MKSKFFKVLGVVAAVAMIAAAIVAPAAAVSSVTATVSSSTNTINAVGNYSIYATLASQLMGASTANITLVAVGDSIKFTEVNTYDKVTLTGAVASLTPTLAGTAAYASGVLTFTGAGTATFTAAVANTTGTYTINQGNPTVTLGGTATAPATASGDSITVTFPTGYTVAAPTATLAATAGWVTFPGGSANNISAGFTYTPTWSFSASLMTVTVTLPAGDYIGAQSQILINITAGITNPGTAGNYSVTVATSQETTAVTSSTFAIANPTIATVPGVATVYNSSGVQLAQTNSLTTAFGAVTSGGTIKLTAGTYTDPTNSSTSFTLMGTDPSAANVIIKGTSGWTLSGKNVTVNMLTINGSKGGLLTISGAGTGAVVVSACNLTGGVLTVNNTGTGATTSVTNDAFTVATGATGLVTSAATTVSGSTFTVAGTGVGISNSVASNDTITGCTFTGASDTSDAYLGNGISLSNSGTAGSAINTSTFTGLTNALTVSGGAATFNANTVTNCGEASPPAVTASAAIVVSGTTSTNLYQNTITAGTYQIISVTANANLVNVSQNTFGTNAKNAANTDATTTDTLNMTHNWWGSAANVPANVTGSDAITYAPALNAAVSASTFNTASIAAGAGSASSPLTSATTAGVNITGVNVSTTAPALTVSVGATALAGNPTSIAIPSADTAVKYFDVYGNTNASSSPITGATVDFYGTTAAPVVNTSASQSAVLFYNAITGTWVDAGGSINTYGNYVEIYIGSGQAGTSVMTPAQFNGTPFVLVTVAVPLSSIVPPTATPIYPDNGATGVPINNLTFTWPAVAGTGVTYQFALAQASANTSANWFAILDYSDNTTTNAEPSQEILQPNTIYWWEVRAVTMNSSGGIADTGPWSVQMFTTAPAATATTTGAAVTITQTNTSVIVTQPVTTVQSTVTSVVITQTTGTSTQAIPSYLLWAVIAVGAILVIAVIVLIVRTRRIP